VIKDVAKNLTKALRAEIKDGLNGAPAWVVDRTQAFVAGFHPLVRAPRRAATSTTASPGGNGSNYISNPLEEDSHEDVARDYQDFYATLEEDIRTGGSPTILMRRSKDEAYGEDEKERERRSRIQENSEARIREILEMVERTICSAFYERSARKERQPR
jgi:hypothetical protein